MHNTHFYTVSKDKNTEQKLLVINLRSDKHEWIFLFNILYYIIYALYMSCDMIMWLITKSLYSITVGNQFMCNNFHEL